MSLGCQGGYSSKHDADYPFRMLKIATITLVFLVLAIFVFRLALVGLWSKAVLLELIALSSGVPAAWVKWALKES